LGGVEKNKALLAIVLPCFNEGPNIPDAVNTLLPILDRMVSEDKISPESFLFFVDDGSSDDTWTILSELNSRDERIKAIRLSRNEGHQQALLAGMMKLKGKVDCAITIDADLQQNPDAIPEFVERYTAGADIVFGIRKGRKTDSAFKRMTAGIFYSLMRVMGVSVHRDHADYRLVSRKVLEALGEYREVNLFLRGIFANMGFNADYVSFDVRGREKGHTKYTLRKMVMLAVDAITSFSVVPLRLVALTGVLLFLFSIGMSLFALIAKFKGLTLAGWSSTVFAIYFLGGLQLLSLGLIGEYIGKIYKEVKSRPRYMIRDELG